MTKVGGRCNPRLSATEIREAFTFAAKPMTDAEIRRVLMMIMSQRRGRQLPIAAIAARTSRSELAIYKIAWGGSVSEGLRPLLTQVLREFDVDAYIRSS